MPWPNLLARLQREWLPGECVTLIGPRGSGKTHIELALAEIPYPSGRRRYILFLATKRQDPLIAGLRAKGYLVTGDLAEVTWAQNEPTHPRVVYWPQFGERLDGRAREKEQAAAMRRALDWADKTGGWTVFIDETMWMVENLRLEREIKALYFQGRTQGLSGVACAQRPSHVPRIIFSSSDYLFLAQTGDRRDVLNLREISAGMPVDLIESAVAQLDASGHEFLFIDTKRREMARVTAPAH